MSRAFLEALEDEQRNEALAYELLDDALEFLETVAGGMTPNEAMQKYGFKSWVQFRKLPWFQELFILAQECWAGFLEQEAQRRAVDGVDEPVFYQGSEVGSVRRYDSQLLQMMLRGLRPERYREKQDLSIAPISIKISSKDAEL